MFLIRGSRPLKAHRRMGRASRFCGCSRKGGAKVFVARVALSVRIWVEGHGHRTFKPPACTISGSEGARLIWELFFMAGTTQLSRHDPAVEAVTGPSCRHRACVGPPSQQGTNTICDSVEHRSFRSEGYRQNWTWPRRALFSVESARASKNMAWPCRNERVPLESRSVRG